MLIENSFQDIRSAMPSHVNPRITKVTAWLTLVLSLTMSCSSAIANQHNDQPQTNANRRDILNSTASTGSRPLTNRLSKKTRMVALDYAAQLRKEGKDFEAMLVHDLVEYQCNPQSSDPKALQKERAKLRTVDDFFSMVENHPTSYQAHLGLGQSLQQLHQYSKAAAEFRRVLELEPENTETKKLLSEAENAAANLNRFNHSAMSVKQPMSQAKNPNTNGFNMLGGGRPIPFDKLVIKGKPMATFPEGSL